MTDETAPEAPFQVPESVRRMIAESEERERQERADARAAGAEAARRRLGLPEPKPARERTRLTDPDTSFAAAASVEDLTASQRAVLLVLRTSGPLTDDQLVRSYKGGTAMRGGDGAEVTLPEQSMSGLRTRRHELVEGGLVEKVGEVIGRTGRRMTVWGAKANAAAA